MPDKLNDFFQDVLKVGTTACGIFWGAVFVVLGILLITIGFWKTLLVAILFLLGLFVGGVKDKQAFIRGIVNRVIPAPNTKRNK